MNKVALVALLIAFSIEAQPGAAEQDNALAQSEVRSQSQRQPNNEEAVQKLRDFGYFTDVQPNGEAPKPAQCAIPLRLIPVPDKKRFSSKTIPANPAIDPKVVSTPSMPTCSQPRATPTTPSEPVDKAKPSERLADVK
jgi:hypothetical protein